MKDERLAQIREELEGSLPEDPAHLLEHAKRLHSFLAEAIEELREIENSHGGEFGRKLRNQLEQRITRQNLSQRELPPGVEVVSLAVCFTTHHPVVDVRMKLVPVEDLIHG